MASAFARAWDGTREEAIADEIVSEIVARESDPRQRIEWAVQLVQEEYRHLAAEGELDARPPAPPELVAQRRYGDTKDLTFFLAHLLRQLGIPARPLLVSGARLKSARTCCRRRACSTTWWWNARRAGT